MNMRGIRRMNFLMIATSEEHPDFPRDVNVNCQAIWIPSIPDAAI